MKYYKVVTKCGHVGRKFYIPIAYAVVADCGREASAIARNIPRVKHDKKYAILSCEEISYDEYLEVVRINSNDPYLKCHNIQQQNAFDLSQRICKEDEVRISPSYDKEERIYRIKLRNKKEREYLESLEGESYEYLCK